MIDAPTRLLLQHSLRELFAANTGAAAIGAALDTLGWAEVRATDPAAADVLLFTEQGRALATSRVLDDVLLAELAAALPAPTGPRAVLYPHPLDDCLPAEGRPARGLLLGPLGPDTEVVGPVRSSHAVGLVVGPATAIVDRVVPVAGFDTGSGWLAVLRGPAAGTPALETWTRAEAAGRRALAAEIIGVCEAALAAVLAHATTRVQFGRPLAAFQAVRHRLAEAYVEVAAARSALDAAVTATGEPGCGAWAARLAKIRAGRTQAVMLRHTLQVLGATGLAHDNVMHRYVTRAAGLDALLGDHASLAELTGSDLLAGVPAQPVVSI